MDDEAAEEAMHLEQVHMMVRRMPVWPTNMQIIAQIAASVALPLALLVVQVFLEKALRMP